MHLEQLKLTNYKNYENERLSFLPTINAFCGRNGMGKTNLLDAIHYLCLTKSYFSSSDRYVARHEADFFRVEGQFEEAEKTEKIVAKVQPGKTKVMERNGTPYQRLYEHIGFQPVVIVSPDDTLIATGGSEERRRLLDNSLSQLDQSYLHDLMTYNRVLNQRNALLKQMAKDQRFDSTLLRALDRQLLLPADNIYQARAQFIMAFTPIVQSTYEAISSRNETVDGGYKSQLHDTTYEELLDESLQKDRLLQRTTTGIHRDDFVFTIDGHPLKRFGSQGQLKTFVIALKLAQYLILQDFTGRQPILLLDDVFDKLDPKRVQNLLDWLTSPQESGKQMGQIFLTDTDIHRLQVVLPKFSESKIFLIENGNATPVPTEGKNVQE